MAQKIRGIRPRGTRWFVDVTHGGVRKTATCDTWEDAVQVRAQLLDALKSGKPVDRVKPQTTRSSSYTLEEAFNAAYQERWALTQDPSHAKSWGTEVMEILGRHTPVCQIDRGTLGEYMTTLRDRGNSTSTIRTKLSKMRVLLSMAEDRGKINSVPKFPAMPKTRAGRIRFLWPEEERELIRLFRAWALDDMADAVAVLVDTGLRKGELLRLKGHDLDPKITKVTVWESKGGTSRTVPLTPRAQGILRGRKDRYGMGRLFPTLTSTRMFWAWDRARNHMGLAHESDFVIHALRHTCATRLAQSNLNLRKIQRWLGHASIKQTTKYTQAYPSELEEGAEMLARYGNQGTPGVAESVAEVADVADREP